MTPARRVGLAALILTLLADQASKLYLLFGFPLADRQLVAFAPFIDLVYTWNKGVSFSLFTQDGALGRWLLVGFTLLATLALLVWLWRNTGRVVALGLGLVIGGALGNLADRIAYGAVFDFVRMDFGFFVWPAIFNVADIAIVAGVLALMYDSLLTKSDDASQLP